MAQIGISKEFGMLDKYTEDKSRFSCQEGNQVFADNTIVGGFTTTGEYVQKYAGGDGKAGEGATISHGNYEVFEHTTEQPEPPVFFD